VSSRSTVGAFAVAEAVAAPAIEETLTVAEFATAEAATCSAIPNVSSRSTVG
jgi:hypothetical protein